MEDRSTDYVFAEVDLAEVEDQLGLRQRCGPVGIPECVQIAAVERRGAGSTRTRCIVGIQRGHCAGRACLHRTGVEKASSRGNFLDLAAGRGR